MLNSLITLVILFQLKHFLADYPLQNEYMLGKFREKGWVLPLLSHVGVHALLTFVIVFGFELSTMTTSLFPFGQRVLITMIALGAALVDATTHFVMDRVKASPKMLGRFKPLTEETYATASEKERRGNNFFWLSIGFDQLIHGLSDTVIVWWLMSSV